MSALNKSLLNNLVLCLIEVDSQGVIIETSARIASRISHLKLRVAMLVGRHFDESAPLQIPHELELDSSQPRTDAHFKVQSGAIKPTGH